MMLNYAAADMASGTNSLIIDVKIRLEKKLTLQQKQNTVKPDNFI
jgi:hypothetical protein